MIGRRLALTLPLKASYRIAFIAANAYYFFARESKRNLTCNLRIALGITDEALMKKYTKAVFVNFAKYLVDFFRLPKLEDDLAAKRIQIEGRENLERALKEGKGVIALSAHLGNWELGAAVTASLGHPFNVIVLDHKYKRIDDFFTNQRRICNEIPILLGNQLKNCFRVLSNNELLAIMGDRDFTQNGVETDFFGRPAILPKGPASLSLKTGAAIVPTFLTRREGERFVLTFEKPIAVKITRNKDEDAKNIMKEYFSIFERYIKAFPDQWFAFTKLWK